ncbi:MAG TPA: hypothetical protein DDW50_22435 [Firmicutes bacterium]|nr:hypothetical protein [Bacillota bacterium]
MNAETRVVKKKGLKAVDVAVVAVLLAVGAVLRMFCPPLVAGITPNFVIGMYCLAILLLRPKLSGAIGIGLVAGAVCQLTTKSAIPFLSFVSEPLGALAVYLLAFINIEVGVVKYIRVFVISFLGTTVSGSVFVGIMIQVLTASGKNTPALAALSAVVLITALFNAILASVLYVPLKTALSKNR